MESKLDKYGNEDMREVMESKRMVRDGRIVEVEVLELGRKRREWGV